MSDFNFSYYQKPLVGVLVGNETIEKLNKQKPGFKISALAEANKVGKVTLYFFSIKDVNPNLKLIIGTYFDEKEGFWARGIFPYPQVLYRRGGPSLSRKKLKYFWTQLKQMGSQHLNGPAFDKWEVYKKLRKNKEIEQHLPSTIIFKEVNDLKLMINKHTKVYLKGCRGGKGKQVIRVEQLTTEFFEYRYFRNNQLIKGVVSFKGLLNRISKFYNNKPFIIQEAIDLPKMSEGIYDMRSEVQRNGKGELEIVDILVRVANPGSPITQFASSYLFDYFFSKFTNYSDEESMDIKENIKTFLVKIYTAIEDDFGPYGEIGIDFALDKKGRLWFIETNSQPAKVSLIKASSNETIQRVFSNPLEYAKFISKAEIIQ